MRISLNCDFVSMVRLIDDERDLTACGETLGSEKMRKIFLNN